MTNDMILLTDYRSTELFASGQPRQPEFPVVIIFVILQEGTSNHLLNY